MREVLDSFETTINFLSEVACDPGKRERLIDDPKLLNRAVNAGVIDKQVLMVMSTLYDRLFAKHTEGGGIDNYGAETRTLPIGVLVCRFFEFRDLLTDPRILEDSQFNVRLENMRVELENDVL